MNERIIQAISKLKKAQDELEIKLKSMEHNIDEKGSLNMQKALFTVADDLARYTIKDGNWYYNGKDTGIQAEAHDGKDGVQGPQGKPGKDGIPGKDGRPGKDGKPGKDGRPGRDGKDGRPGKDGKDGKPGRDGKDGITPELKIGKIEVSPEYGGAMAKLRPGKDNIMYLDLTLPRGPQGFAGFDGKDAKINGVNTLTIEAGDNITLDQEGNTLTINSTGGGSGGTSNYNALTNKPKINNVELNGNKSLNDLGIQPVGSYALESDMIEAQNDIDHLSKVSNLFEKITGTGTSVTLNDTSDTIMKLNLDTTTSSQESTTGKNKFGVDYIRNNQATILNTNTNDFKITEKWASNFISNDNVIKMLKPNTTYTASYKYRIISRPGSLGSANQPYMLLLYNGTASSNVVSDNRKNIGALNTWFEGTNTFTTSSDLTNWRILSYTYKDENNDNAGEIEISELQIEEGQAATDFEPYTNGPAPNPDYPISVNVVTGDNEVIVSNGDNTQSQTYPINLGSMELCKIGDYKDILFKNTMDSEYYNSSLELNKWYKLNNIGKVVLDGSESGWATMGMTTLKSYQLPITNLKPNASSDSLTNYLCSHFKEYTPNALWTMENGNGFAIIKTSNNIRFTAGDTTDELKAFKTWLSTHNTTLYYVLKTPTYTLLNDTLQTQLDNIQYALAYDTQTNISQTNTDLPFIIDAETYAKIKVDLTDYVKNTDYASSSKGGVVKVGYGCTVTPQGNLISLHKTYPQYQSGTTNDFISKGTLESVITGKGLIDSSYHDSTKQDIEDNTLTTVHKTIPTAINEVDSIAKGANQALSYVNYSAMVTAFNSLANNVYNKGQNVMIVTLQVPDLWISGIESTSQTYTYTTDEAITTALSTNGYIQVGYYKLSALETQKVDLTDYVTFDDYATSTTAGVVITNSNFGVSTSSYTKNITAVTKTYAQYQNGNNAMFVGKGTLENVITGKELDLKQLSTFDSTKTQVLKNINGTLTWVDE